MSIRNRQQLDGLEKALLGLDTKTLSVSRKSCVKDKVFSELNFNLIDSLSSLSELSCPLDLRVSVKDRLFETISGSASFVYSYLFKLSKYFLSFTAFSFLFFVFFNFITYDPYVVFADRPSVFKDVVGDVKLERGAETFFVKNGMLVMEGDRIITNGGGVTIRFFDNTESRLGVSSEVVIDRLYSDESDELLTEVQISVIDGDVWSNVVNLVGDSFFAVNSSDALTFVDSKASFNVSVDENKSTIGVYNDIVKVKSNNFNGHVVSGNIIALDNKSVVNSSVVSSTDWVALNLDQDTKHEDSVEDKLLNDKISIVDGAVSDVVASSPSVSSADSSFGRNDFDEFKKSFSEFEKNFIAADVELHLAKSSESVSNATDSIMKFYDVVDAYYADLDEIRKVDPVFATEFDEYLDGRVSYLKKSVALANPSAPEYLSVMILDDLKIVGASNDSEKLAAVQVEVGLDKLSTVGDVLNDGDIELAKDILGDGVEVIESVSSDIPEDVMSDYLVALDVAQGYENQILSEE